MLFIPPAHKDKLDLSKEMFVATRQANIKDTPQQVSNLRKN
jgi:hypothetical protein